MTTPTPAALRAAHALYGPDTMDTTYPGRDRDVEAAAAIIDSELRPLVEAARKLAVEALGVAELARYQDIGNTNANVLIRKANAVRDALGETDA